MIDRCIGHVERKKKGKKKRGWVAGGVGGWLKRTTMQLTVTLTDYYYIFNNEPYITITVLVLVEIVLLLVLLVNTCVSSVKFLNNSILNLIVTPSFTHLTIRFLGCGVF